MSNVDALDALHQANPRHQAGFDRGVAAMAGHTREALAAAGGVAGGSIPAALNRVGGGPYRRSRWLLSLLVVTGAIALTVGLVIRGNTSVPRSNPLQASPRVGPSLPGPAAGSGAVGTATTSSIPSTSPPTTVGPVPTTTVSLPSVVPGPTNPADGTGGTGPIASTTRPLVVTTRPSSTTSTAAPSTVAPATPTCAISALLPGPPQHQEVRVQDVGSGLASISNVAIINGTVNVPNFPRGTTAMVLVVAIKTDPTKATEWSFDATDVAGRTTHCT